VPAAGYEFHEISVEGLSRSNPALAARALLRAGGAVAQARALLRRIGPDACWAAADTWRGRWAWRR